MPSIEIKEHSDIDQAFRVIDQYATTHIKKNKTCYLNFSTDKGMSREQRGAMHVWFRNVAQTLNDAGLLCVKKALFSSDMIEIDWTESMIKDMQYKPLLRQMANKLSTEHQSTIEPSQVAETMIRFYGQKGVVLPPWPSRRG